ncbi:MAG: hypothetical protein QOF73_1068 [Thermomicrobiales bacterium]|nr:hypothetical protein [Thermomicrobiales bacterium]
MPSARSRSALDDLFQTTPIQYGIAVGLAVGAALLTRQSDSLQDHTPYLLSFAAVMLASWNGGLGPGLLATLISVLAVDYYVRPPLDEFSLTDRENALTATLFIAVSAMVSWLNAARLQAEAAQVRLLHQERSARSSAEEARHAADEGRVRMTFLADASAALAFSLDYTTTLRKVADLVVPGLADWCAVHVVGDDGTPEQLVVTHVDPEKLTWARHLQERYPTDPNAERGLHKVLRTGTPELYAEIPEELLIRAAQDQEHLTILRSVGMTSAMIVPMIARNRTVGAISFVATESGRHYGQDDQALAEILARRCAQAVDNARLYRDAQAAEARYRSLFEGTAEAVLVAGPDGRYLDANAAATDLLGYAREEIQGLRLEDVSREGADWADEEQQQLLREGVWRGEVELRRKDGAVIPAEGRARAVELPAGTVYVGTWRDISERKELERLQQEFLATVSHDLNNPLSALKVQAQLLQRRLARNGAPDLDQLRDGANAIAAMVTRMEGLLDELSDIARVRLGQPLELRLESLDLADFVQRYVELHPPSFDHHQVRLVTDTPELSGTWDPARLERVLDNLLGNAVKYSPDGGEIEVRLASEADAGGRWAVLTVRDRGVGIPAADLPSVFRRFYRATNVVGRFTGSGIGLAGVRQIVEQHGGTIAVDSEEGRGSTFTVRLPLTTPA